MTLLKFLQALCTCPTIAAWPEGFAHLSGKTMEAIALAVQDSFSRLRKKDRMQSSKSVIARGDLPTGIPEHLRHFATQPLSVHSPQ